MNTIKLGLVFRILLVTGLLTLLSSHPAVAAGSLAGNARQGEAAPAGSYLATPSDSALATPFTIPELPEGSTPPTLDGACGKSEYYGGLITGFTDGPSGTGTGIVYLLHDATNLYMCIQSPVGTDSARFDSLYLDPQGDGSTYTFANPNDFSLRLDFDGNKNTFVGDGAANGWTDVSDPDNNLWKGLATTGSSGDVAEYLLPLANFNIYNCVTLFGIAGYHHWFSTTGDDYGWPSGQYFDQPGTWQPVVLGGSGCGYAGNLAYVYKNNTADAISFFNSLSSFGYTVTLVPLSSVLATDFSQFDLTVIADDTGDLNIWGDPPSDTAAQVAQIVASNKPILGLGEGGYAFFGRLALYIGWVNGWHGPEDYVTRAAGSPPAIFSGVGPDPVQYTTSPTNSVGIDTAISHPANVTLMAMEYPPVDLQPHATIIQQGCRMLWGNSGNPNLMTEDGYQLFRNTVSYTRRLNCISWSIFLPMVMH